MHNLLGQVYIHSKIPFAVRSSQFADFYTPLLLGHILDVFKHFWSANSPFAWNSWMQVMLVWFPAGVADLNSIASICILAMSAPVLCSVDNKVTICPLEGSYLCSIHSWIDSQLSLFTHPTRKTLLVDSLPVLVFGELFFFEGVPLHFGVPCSTCTCSFF